MRTYTQDGKAKQDGQNNKLITRLVALTFCSEYNHQRGMVRWDIPGNYRVVQSRRILIVSHNIFSQKMLSLDLACLKVCSLTCTTQYYFEYRRTNSYKNGFAHVVPRRRSPSFPGLTHWLPIPLEYRLVPSTQPCPSPRWPACHRPAHRIVLPSPVRSIKPPGNAMG